MLRKVGTMFQIHSINKPVFGSDWKGIAVRSEMYGGTAKMMKEKKTAKKNANNSFKSPWGLTIFTDSNLWPARLRSTVQRFTITTLRRRLSATKMIFTFFSRFNLVKSKASPASTINETGFSLFLHFHCCLYDFISFLCIFPCAPFEVGDEDWAASRTSRRTPNETPWNIPNENVILLIFLWRLQIGCCFCYGQPVSQSWLIYDHSEKW